MAKMVAGLPDAVVVVLLNLLVALSSEVLIYLWVYRTAGFKSVKVLNITARPAG